MGAAADILRQYWGHAAFRPLQEDIINSIVEGRDTLALLPTGGGKSVCFQVPALLAEGVTLVVSPLIALMKDQVHQLRDRGIVADAIYSGMRAADIDRVFDNAVYGNTKLLYLSPERLQTDLARERIRRMPLSLLAVDEAHCISQWGYDFRPPYQQIAEVRELHPEVAVIALTATATPEVVQDIETYLEFRPGHRLFHQSFARTNLSYIVRRPADKEQQLLEVLEGVAGSAIVYVRSRGMTKEIAYRLGRRGIPAAAYHAGLEPEERDQRQANWIEGRIRVMVATNAFGMGIDKADVRTVVHYGPPDSPEAYFQEAGRGGRDGKTSYGVMLYHPTDGERLMKFWEQNYPELDEIRRIYRALGSYLQLAVGGGKGETYAFDLAGFCATFGFEARQTFAGLKALERAGYLLFIERLHERASLQFIISKEDLYAYRIRNAWSDKLIKSVLRTSQGAFINPVSLREGALANFLGIDVETLRANFRQMQQDGIIDYVPEREGPQLVFLTERLDADNVRIDSKRYAFLKERAHHRVETMIQYGSQDRICRSRLLLQYFGETEAETCGVCDVCRKRKRSIPTSAEVRQRLTVLTQAGSVDTQSACRSFGRVYEREVADLIQQLINDGLFQREGDQILRP